MSPPAAPPLPKRSRWLRNAAEALLFLVVFLGIRAWTQRDALHGVAPDVAGVGSQGETLSLNALRGKPALVHFWGTWCSVCKAEKGNIDAVARDHAVLGVAVDSGSAVEVAAWMQREGVRFPSLVDGGTLARTFGVHSFPTTFVVDGQGRIQFVEVGYTTELGLRARLWWAALQS